MEEKKVEITDELLDALNDVPVENRRYVISSDMSEELRRVCESVNKRKDEREKYFSEKRKIKRSMGL